ncbi:MAG: ECF-type sigma factor [Planctomycetota bacterium]|nr:ECF-type sigma factor [Planctomycetota bacterium]
MPQVDAQHLTTLLNRAAGADSAAAQEIFASVYDELRRLAAELMRAERADHTLQPTALVHEAFMRMMGGAEVGWKNRAHFFACAARAMRRMLVDHARARSAAKRGGGWGMVTLDSTVAPGGASALDVVALNDALEELESRDARAARVVEMRFFGGLTIDEVSQVLGVATSTVDDDWAFSRAWLARRLDGGRAG